MLRTIGAVVLVAAAVAFAACGSGSAKDDASGGTSSGGSAGGGMGGSSGAPDGGAAGNATSGAAGVGGGTPAGRCGSTPPPGAVEPDPPPAYSDGTCPTLSAGTNTIQSAGNTREFILVHLAPTENTSKYQGLWDFALDHPYWLGPGESPYTTTGLPASLPEWCGIGQGSATPRTGECLDPSQC